MVSQWELRDLWETPLVQGGSQSGIWGNMGTIPSHCLGTIPSHSVGMNPKVLGLGNSPRAFNGNGMVIYIFIFYFYICLYISRFISIFNYLF